MNPILVLVSASLLGVEVGWQPLAEGGHEYTIQIEPNLIPVLQRGNAIVSEVPPQINVRKYRVTIDTGTLPKIDGQAHAPAHQPEAHQPAKSQPPHEHSFSLPPIESGANDPSHGKPKEMDEVFGDDQKSKLVDVPARLKAHQGGENLNNHKATFETNSEAHSTKKPALKEVPAGEVEPARPWWAFVISAFLLCCSLGANVYLGWIAWDFRAKYRDALDRFRPATAA